jgi:hypothetical protein
MGVPARSVSDRRGAIERAMKRDEAGPEARLVPWRGGAGGLLCRCYQLVPLQPPPVTVETHERVAMPVADALVIVNVFLDFEVAVTA